MNLKHTLILMALLAATPAMAKTYPFTLAEPDAKAEAAIDQLFDAKLLTGRANHPEKLLAIWLKASDSEANYLFVAPVDTICGPQPCRMKGFRPKGDGWTKVYDQPVGDDIEIGLADQVTDGHHAIQQIDEAPGKTITRTSLWMGDKYGSPTSTEAPVDDTPSIDSKN